MVLPLGDVERTRITPWATYALIALNVVMYLVQCELGETFTVSHAATPFEITHAVDIGEPFSLSGDPRDRDLIQQGPIDFPVWLTLLTSLFLHGSPLHLAGNMLYLWIFGDNVEEILGAARYVVTYLICGVCGSLAQILVDPDSVIPTLGASGAIAGVMGMYLVWFPHNRVRVLVFQFLTEMPALLVVGLWIIAQVLLGLGAMGQTGESGGVAYLAHVGGFATGFAAARLYQTRMMEFRSREYDDAWYEQGRRF